MDLDLVEVEDLSIGSITSARVDEEGYKREGRTSHINPSCPGCRPYLLSARSNTITHFYLQTLCLENRKEQGELRKITRRRMIKKKMKRKKTHRSIFATSSKVTPSLLTGGPP
jgi:hypothetical protein